MSAALPNGEDGLDPEGWLSFFTNKADMTKLPARTRANITDYYRNMVQGDSGWNGASGTFFDVILHGFQNLGEFITLIVQAITGAPGGLENLQAFLSDRWADVAAAMNAALDALERLAAMFGLDGLLKNTILPLIGISSLTDEEDNLLLAGNFGPDSVAGNPYWSYEAGVTHTADGSGSVKVVADGTKKSLRSNEIRVTPKQSLSLDMFVMWSGYSGTGSPIKLQLVEYSGYGDDAVQTGIKDIATLNPPAGAGTWRLMSGSYVVPDGVQSVKVRIFITRDALTGTFNFDDGVSKKTNKIQQSWISGFADTLQQITSRWQLIIDTIVNALGLGGALHTLEELADAIKSIPLFNILGFGGPGDALTSFQEFLSHILGGASGSSNPTSGGFADVFNVMKLLQVAAGMGQSAFQELSIRNNTSIDSGLLPSGRSNYGLTSINTTLSTTQSVSLASALRVKQDIAVGVISWLGCGTSGMSAFYINIWKMNAENGNRDLVHHSPSILADIVPGSTPNWNFYQLDTPFDWKASETYEIEWVPVGGTHSIRGISTDDDIPDHPFAKVQGLASKRNNSSAPNSPPSSIDKSSVVRSGDIPWVEIAIDTGNGAGYYDPIGDYVLDSGSIPVPSWCNFIDAIAVGGAGGGQMGLTLGFSGEPGSPGLFKSVTWQRGVHFSGDVFLTFTKGVGGLGGRPGHDDGADGTGSTWSIPDYSITAAPGVGGTELQFGGNPIGRGPGTIEYKGLPIVAGGDQKVPGAAGVPPGGAGNGGNNLTFQSAGKGADGAGWYRFRQNPLEGEEVIGGPGQVHVAGIESGEAFGTAVMSGGLSLLPLEDQAAIDAIVAANLTAPGATLAIQSPDGYYTKAYGKVSTAAGARNVTLDDHFRIGSCTKSFTATMILQAVDRGLLALDDPLEKFFPGVPSGAKMTIRHMLSLRSGLFNEQADMGMMIRYFLSPASDWADEQTLEIMKAHQPMFEPGSSWAYVNANFILLGMIVALVNGRPTRDVLQTDILDPLGLTETSYPTTAKMPEPYANGHAYTTGLLGGWAWQEATETGPGYASWAGSMISTVHDLLLWAKELRDGTLLSPELHALRSEYYWPVPWGNDDQLTHFGYGLGMFELAKWRGHGGSWRGYEVSVYYLPNGTLFAMCENAQTPTVEVEVSMMFKIGKYLYPDSMDQLPFPNQVFGIPDSGGVGKPLFGNIDVKFDNKSTVDISQSEIPSFTIASDANIAFAYMTVQTGTAVDQIVAKVGGATMNRLPVINQGTNNLLVWWLLDPPTGAQSIKLLNTPYGSYYSSGAASYKLAAPAGIGTPVIAKGYGSTASVSATSNAHGMTVNAFLYEGTKSTYSQTERGYRDAAVFANRGLVFGDAPGGAATFTTTLTADGPWIGIAIPIISNAE